jgi:hypothetical protein
MMPEAVKPALQAHLAPVKIAGVIRGITQPPVS